ncbi:MAG: sigma-70 family RNA polymerase sigma factor [Verrucomicrobia bacterium]|nr:sigma-70 family RNA polymerase sigma factor [Verrucomicrobiota bacterium]MBT5310945.1 sigma-70 family RNA polymerase sigma factor [Verrucomicrobiota bacterium]
MNYGASVVDEVAPTGSKAPPSPRAAETAALGQTEKEIRCAESRRLAIAAQSGCIESFESLVGQFEKPLYHFLLTKTRNHHQAQDLLQDTFLITYRKLDSFNPSYPFSSWIYTIANRLAISHYRKQKTLLEEVEFVIETTACNEVMEQECARSLWAYAKRLLTKNHFTALRLFYTEGMTIDQVAAAMNRNPNSVKVWLHRARKRLAQELNPRPSMP